MTITDVDFNRFTFFNSGRNIEKSLMQELFKDYNMKVRPVQNVLSTVQLKFDIALKQILDVVSSFAYISGLTSFEDELLKN